MICIQNFDGHVINIHGSDSDHMPVVLTVQLLAKVSW